MAYKAKKNINWCPKCKTGLSNEDSAGGVCERCGSTVIQKEKSQWMLRMSNYAEDLLKGLDETTNGKGVARNFESTGGYDQTLKDFDALNPSNVKDIQTKYGPGKVGTLSDGTKVVARQGSTTGGPTLEIKVSNSKVYKIRY